VLFFQAPPTHDTTADQVIGQESTTTLQASLAADADSFSGPVDMVIDENNQLAVVDNNNSRVLIFDNPSLQPVDPTQIPVYLPLIQR